MSDERGVTVSDRAAPATSGPLTTLLRSGAWWRWAATANACRTPPLMSAVAFSGLTVGLTGSAELGGGLVAAMVIGQTAAAGPLGRVIDRTARPALPALLAATAAILLAALAAVAPLGPPVPLLWGLVALAGAALSPLPGLARHRLSGVVGADLLPPALSLDATVVEIVVVGAPLVVALLLLPGSTGGVLAMAAACAAAACLLWRDRRTAPCTGRPREGGTSRLPRGPFLAWCLVSVAFGHALGAVEIAAVSISVRLGGGSLGGVAVIAVLALTAFVVGLLYTSHGAGIPGGPSARITVALPLVAVALLALATSGTWWFVLLATALVGSATAPVNAIRSHALEAVVPSDRRAEAFSWQFVANGIGFAGAGIALAALPLGVSLALPAVTCVLATTAVLLVGRTR